MFRFLKIVLGLLFLLIIVAVAVPFLVPADKVKDQLLAEIDAKIGREVSIDHVSFVLFPSLALKAEGVKIGNPLWVGSGYMVEAKSLKIGLELMPLLHKEYKVDELTLDEPTIVLIQQKGRNNWTFGKEETRYSEPAKSSPSSATTEELPKTKTHEMLERLHLARIAINDGSLTFRDEVRGTTQEITSVNAELTAPELNEKAVFSFSAEYKEKKAELRLTLDKPFAAYEIGSLTGVNLKASYGDLDLAWVGQVSFKPDHTPFLNGKIIISQIDVAALTQKDEASATSKSAPTPAANALPPVKTGPSHWSTAPIKLDALTRADADLAISINTLTLPKTTFKDIVLTVHLDKDAHGRSVLQAQSNSISAYGGIIKLGVNASDNGTMGVSFTASKAEAEPLLHDFAGYDRVSGTIDLETQLSATGQSQRELVGSVAGKGSVQFKNGKLKGVNLPGLLRRITGGQNAEEGTDFSDLSGTFTVAKGIVTTNDFKMNSPLLRVTGAGTADLPNWQEHFLLKPMLVASLEGQGGKDASGIVIPVNVEGPLDHPQYQPDFKAALQENLKDPAALKKNLKNIREEIKESGGLKGLLR